MAVAGETDSFEQRRPMLSDLAYRILGSRVDAEDAVQDTYLKWQSADRAAIDNPDAWLTATCTRRAIDLLRSAHKRRVEYVGAWLPEPLQTPGENPEEQAKLASSLETAFLLLLERLTPKERAAYLLHEVFDIAYSEIAQCLEMEEPACRKLVSRARANISRSKVRNVTPRETQEQLLVAFQAAVVDGDAGRLTQLLSTDISLSVDSGGKVPSLREVLHGRPKVLEYISQSLHTYWSENRWERSGINGAPGIVLRRDGSPVAVVSFGYDEQGKANAIYIVRNPEKLAHLDRSGTDSPPQ